MPASQATGYHNDYNLVLSKPTQGHHTSPQGGPQVTHTALVPMHPFHPAAAWVKRPPVTTALVQMQAPGGGSPIPTSTEGGRLKPRPQLWWPRGHSDTALPVLAPLHQGGSEKQMWNPGQFPTFSFFPPPYLSSSPEPLTKQEPLGTNISCREGSSRGRQQSFPWPQKPPASPKALGLWGGGGLWCFCS